MDRTNNRIGSIRFDDETILEVSQKGGGGAGVGGTGGLEARNLITGESTNDAIEELSEDLEDAQETIETQAGQIDQLTEDLQDANDTIATQAGQIDQLTDDLATANDRIATLEAQLANSWKRKAVSNFAIRINSTANAAVLLLYNGTTAQLPDRRPITTNSNVNVSNFSLFYDSDTAVSNKNVAVILWPSDPGALTFSKPGWRAINGIASNNAGFYTTSLFYEDTPENFGGGLTITAQN